MQQCPIWSEKALQQHNGLIQPALCSLDDRNECLKDSAVSANSNCMLFNRKEVCNHTAKCVSFFKIKMFLKKKTKTKNVSSFTTIFNMQVV